MNANPFVKAGAQYGGIVGLISVVYGVIGYLIGPEAFTTWWVGILLFILIIVILILGVTKTRKLHSESDGSFPFRNAFTVFLIGGTIATIIGAIFNILLFNVIDPEFKDKLADAIYDMTLSMMERFGASDEDIDKALEKAVENDQFSIKNQLLSIPKSIIFYAVVGLIVAAATKRRGQPFHTIDSDVS